jgi:hypothetical protein
MQIGDHAYGPTRHSLALQELLHSPFEHQAREVGGGLLIFPDLFGQTDFRLFCLN